MIKLTAYKAIGIGSTHAFITSTKRGRDCLGTSKLAVITKEAFTVLVYSLFYQRELFKHYVMSRERRRILLRKKYVCPLCENYARNSYAGVLTHIGEIHSFDPNFRIECGLGPANSKCPNTYTIFASFRSHVYRKHKEELYANDTTVINSSNSSADVNETVGSAELEQEISLNSQDSDANSSHQNTRSAALFILRTTEVHRVSQVTI